VQDADDSAANHGPRMNRSTIATDIDSSPAHGWMSSSRPNFDRQVRFATRHSRRIRRLRVGIPIVVVLGIAVIGLASWIKRLPLPPISIGSLGISGTKITMEVPRIAGYTRDARPYEFTAKTAAQDLTQPDRIELQGVHASITMQERGLVDITAANGLYQSKTEQLMLRENVVLTSTSGYEGYFSEVLIDIRGGHVLSEKPVRVKMVNGLLNANRLEIVEGGELMRFEGNVVVLMNLGEDKK